LPFGQAASSWLFKGPSFGWGRVSELTRPDATVYISESRRGGQLERECFFCGVWDIGRRVSLAEVMVCD
jgi:hypothetical protein